jgi:MFS family permease
MVPLRLFRVRTFAAGNATGFLMTGSILAAGFFVTQYFQLALGNSPLMSGLKLLPWTATPMVVAPLAGALSDRIGRRPVMATGLFLQAAGFSWVALKASAGASYAEIAVALLVAGIGISMALPTVPTAVLGSVAPAELGKASGITNMLQRLGAVFAVAICSSVFAAYGSTATSAGVADGFKPVLAVSIGLSLLGALSALATAPRPREAVAAGEPLEATVAL